MSDQNQAIQKARQFARTRYAGETDQIIRQHQQMLGEVRAQLASRGLAVSGAMVSETARIHGEQIKALTLAQLDAILEGYELNGVVIDDQMAVNLCDEIIQGMNNQVHSSQNTPVAGMPGGTEQLYRQLLAQAVGVNAAWVKTQIDRRRLMPKRMEGSTTIYNVQGDNARWNFNSTDQSVNVITKSSAEFFTTLRERIEAGVQDSGERTKVLTALTALEESHGKPSFAQRYTDFIAAAANHMTLLTPFIPALTEMLHQVLK
jgi:hypothetical protein